MSEQSANPATALAPATGQPGWAVVRPPRKATALAQVTGQQAWAVIRLRDSDTVTLVGGTLVEADRLADIPLEEGIPEPGRRFDTLVAVPFRQVAERGFEVHDDGTPLAVVRI